MDNLTTDAMDYSSSKLTDGQPHLLLSPSLTDSLVQVPCWSTYLARDQWSLHSLDLLLVILFTKNGSRRQI